MFYSNVFQWGNRMFVRGYDNNKIPYKEKIEYFPTLYVKSPKPTGFKTLDGIDLQEIKPGSIRDCKDYVERYKDVEGYEIYGQTNYISQFTSDTFTGDIKYDSSLIRVHTWDIETKTESGFPDTATANEEILLITIVDNVSEEYITFGVGPTTKKVKNYHSYSTEYEMLQAFINWHASQYPDVITGWYSNGFDIPYVINRVTAVCGETVANRLSPWGIVSTYSKEFNGQTEWKSSIAGISLIDYLDLYKKFTYEPQESYALDFISNIELDEAKVDYSEHDSFKDFYTNDWDKFVDYNIHDAMLVTRLEKKLKLLEVVFTVAYIGKINYEDVFSPVKTWETIIYNYLRERNIVVPPEKFSQREQFIGGYVKEPKPGMYKYVASFDLQSLYPHLIMQYAISPENLVGIRKDVDFDKLVNKTEDLTELKEKDYTMTANGWMYERKPAMLPDLMLSMYNLRAAAKKEMLGLKQQAEEDKSVQLMNKISSLDNLQMAAKILLNSAYGGIGSPYFNYYDKRMAEGITTSGRLAVLWIERKFNEYLNKALNTKNVDYVIAIDTDSNYLNLERLVEKCCVGKSEEERINFMDRFCKEVLQPFINKSFEELADYMNAYQQKMFMKREALANVGIWTAKKKYILNVWDNEGVRYKQPKLKVVGLQVIQSSTPKLIKDKLKDSLNIIINGTEEQLHKYVLDLENEFSSFAVEDISRTTSANDVDGYYDPVTLFKPKCPIHVRGAILFNKFVKDNNLQAKFKLIKNGDKVKYAYLKQPNHFRQDVISYIGTLPKELKIHDYVDRDKQFEKVYLDPLTNVLKHIGWTCYKTSSIGDLFG